MNTSPKEDKIHSYAKGENYICHPYKPEVNPFRDVAEQIHVCKARVPGATCASHQASALNACVSMLRSVPWMRVVVVRRTSTTVPRQLRVTYVRGLIEGARLRSWVHLVKVHS